MSLTESKVRDALKEVVDPCSVSAGCPISLEEMGLITGLAVADDGSVSIRMRLTAPGCTFGILFEQLIRQRLATVEGVHKVSVEFIDDWSWTEEAISEDARRRLAEVRDIRRQRFLQIAVKGPG